MSGAPDLNAAVAALLDRDWTFWAEQARRCVSAPPGDDPKDPFTHMSPVSENLARAAIAAGVWSPPVDVERTETPEEE